MKRVNSTYYAYYATSKRVPDKKYPVQVIKGLAGRIDESGFHPLSKAFVETEHVIVRECGFTNFLLKFEEEYISRRRMYDFNGTTLSLPWIIRKMRKSELTKYAHIDRIRIGVILEKGRNSYEAKGLFFING